MMVHETTPNLERVVRLQFRGQILPTGQDTALIPDNALKNLPELL